MSPGSVGCHPSSSRVSALEARTSIARKFASHPKCSPASSGAIDDAIAVTLEVVGEAFRDRRDFARRRQLVIAANAELRERELVKLASVAAALADTLRERGVAEPAASVTAETAIAVFRTAFERWVAADDRRGLPEFIRESLEALQAVTTGR